MEDSTVGRTQSKIYNDGKYGPVLRFGSINRGLVNEDDENYNKNFIYNSEKDEYIEDPRFQSRVQNSSRS